MQRWGVFRFRCLVLFCCHDVAIVKAGYFTKRPPFVLAFLFGFVEVDGPSWHRLQSRAMALYEELWWTFCWSLLKFLGNSLGPLFQPQADFCGFWPGPSGGDFRTLTTESWEKIHQRFEWRVTVKWPVHMCLWRLNNKNEGEQKGHVNKRNHGSGLLRMYFSCGEVDGVSESKNGADSDLLLSSADDCIHDDSFCGVFISFMVLSWELLWANQHQTWYDWQMNSGDA